MTKKSKPRARPPLLYVEWIDASGHGAWTDDVPETPLIQSIGFVMARTDESITLAVSHNTEPDQLRWGSPITIPRSAIKRTRRVKVG